MSAQSSPAERLLSLLLRIEAVVLLCALPAVIMPTAWMASIHQALGMGEMPHSPLVEYLTRSLSLLYAALAPVFLVLSTDLPRYLPVVWTLSWVRLGFGVTLLILDMAIGMPLIWVLSEGPLVTLLSLLGLYLIWQIHREQHR